MEVRILIAATSFLEREIQKGILVLNVFWAITFIDMNRVGKSALQLLVK